MHRQMERAAARSAACSVLLVSLQTLAAFFWHSGFWGRLGVVVAVKTKFRSSAPRPIAASAKRRSKITPKRRCIRQPWLRLRIDNEI